MLNTYIEKSSTISISAQVSNDCVIGAKTEIEANCNIIQSCIGPNCKIGKNVKIINSLIDSHVIIEDNCTIQNAILQSHVTLRKGCIISKGAMISQHVIVKEGVTIPEAAICSGLTFDSQEEDFVQANEVDEKYFEKGVISYIPRDMTLKPQELIGNKAYEVEEESDLDEGLEDSDVDPIEEFKNDIQFIFESVLKSK